MVGGASRCASGIVGFAWMDSLSFDEVSSFVLLWVEVVFYRGEVWVVLLLVDVLWGFAAWVVEDGDVDSVGYEGVDEVAADEASSACNQQFLHIFWHFFLIILLLFRPIDDRSSLWLLTLSLTEAGSFPGFFLVSRRLLFESCCLLVFRRLLRVSARLLFLCI